ncbi:CBM1 domain-containing protein [Caenorhabditis elegans]|uniref:CBM1 domain-containing protein n=1 Tax=Caenorhabditis elegans TaxID=6239 RepID=B1GRL1_CAEEL|nr:CBM1 domain-containing protein [Caenorhabditis elegans]CCD66696.1 CBM1 domain-containing protein [Caenorhabditis elegans]|eukprot:NP_001123186.1 Uncharacterized protein CELE_T25B2.3 [Caenorhabditis elegans]
MLQILLLPIVLTAYSHACIPTQNVDSNNPGGSNPGGPSATTTTSSTTTTTTTVATTTTTVTEPPFPCNACPKVYDNTCQGFGIPNLLQWCPTAAEAGITYVLGFVNALLPFLPAGSCGTTIVCPLTTALRIKILGSEIPAPVFYAWCEESGAKAGIWYTGTWLTPIELVSLACKPII